MPLLKLKRAREQTEALDGEIRAYIKGNPYNPLVNFNPKTRELRASVSVTKEPEPMWGVIAGEVIHDLRSALDHLVFELAGRPTATNIKTQFPIFETEPGFDGRGVKQFLHGVPAEAVSLIRNEQPFKTRQDLKAKLPLWHIHQLSNADKHRTLNLIGSLIQGVDLRMPGLKHPIPDLNFVNLEVVGSGPIHNKMLLFRTRVDGTFVGSPFTDAEVHAKLMVKVTFDEGMGDVASYNVVSVLRGMTTRTEEILKLICLKCFKVDL